MSDTAAVISTLLLAHAGFAWLAFAMDRHALVLFKGEPGVGAVTILRLLGSAMLLASIAPCVLAWNATIGIVGWFGMLTPAAAAAALLLRYLPGLTRLLTCLASLVGMAVIALSVL